MLTYALIGLAVLIIGFFITAAMQPDEFRVQRSARISAPASAVFDQVNDLHNWDAWSPWAKLDPNMELTYSGPRAGRGASYAWVGSKQVGEGSMTITDSRPSELVAIQLNFIKPFNCSNEVEFDFKPEDGNTVVTWSMTGHSKFINKCVCLVMNMDKMCGSQFEQGLASIKEIVEAPVAITPHQPFPETLSQEATI